MMKKYGFSLIELLVVISIISILTIISVSQFNTAKIKAVDTQRKSDIDSVYKAVNLYYADYGRVADQYRVAWGSEFNENGVGSYIYMKKVPEETKLVQFCYLPNTDRTSYIILGNMEGVGMTTGDYTVNSLGCDGTAYNYAIPSPNETVTSFCSAYASCSE